MKSILIISLLFIFILNLNGQDEQKTNDVLLEVRNDKERELELSNQYHRLAYYNQSHQSKTKINPLAQNFRAFEEMRTLRNFTNAGNWQFIGPDSMESLGQQGLGRINRLTFHPTDPQKLYASTAGGGLWLTSDGGNYWLSLTDGLPILNTTGLAINPVTTTKLFLLTGDGDGVGSFNGALNFTRSSLGVFKTLNGGFTWEKTGLNLLEKTDPVLTYNIVMNPQDTAEMFVCTDKGIFHTTDEWNTYDTLLTNRDNIYEMQYSPAYPNVAYAIGNDSIYRSSDGGLTWPHSLYILDIDGEVGRMSLDLKANKIALLAGPVSQDTLIRGVFVGTDFNLGPVPQMVKLSDNVNFFGAAGTLKDQSWYDNDIIMNIADPTEIIVGGVFMHKSIDGGSTFDLLSPSAKQYHADAHQLIINPIDSNLYACNDGGLYKSEDFGETWSYISAGMSYTQYYKSDVSPFLSYWLMAGAQDNGIHFRDDIVNTLRKVDNNDGMDVKFSRTNLFTMIGATQFGRVSLTTDAWANRTTILNVGQDSAAWLVPIAFDPTDDSIIYVGTHPILKSIDQGSSWISLSADSVSANSLLEISLSHPDTIYVGEYVNGANHLMRSGDGGNSWTDFTFYSNLNDIRISDLAINPVDPDEIWICLNGYEYANKVYYSDDAGDSWTSYWTGLPNVPMNALTFLPPGNYPDGSVYVACDIGVFYTNPDIGYWLPFFNGLPAVEVVDIDPDLINSDMVISTYGRGIWRSDMYGTCPDHLVLDNTNQEYFERGVYRAGQSINSSAVITGLGADVIYKAGSEIRLLDGFTLQGSKFATLKAYIGDCEVE